MSAALLSQPWLKIIAQHPSCRAIFMHHLTVPANQQRYLPLNENVTSIVFTWAVKQLQHLESVGISPEKLILM